MVYIVMKIYILLNRSTNHFIKKVYSTKYKQPNFILFLSPSPFTGAAGRIFSAIMAMGLVFLIRGSSGKLHYVSQYQWNSYRKETVFRFDKIENGDWIPDCSFCPSISIPCWSHHSCDAYTLSSWSAWVFGGSRRVRQVSHEPLKVARGTQGSINRETEIKHK